MVILGISGKRGVGKSTLANHLVRACGFSKISFTRRLKEICKMLFPFADADLNTPSLKEKKFKAYDWSPREFMINLGEFIRYHDEHYFIREALGECASKDGFYVFEDCRYENEFNVLKNLGGKIVRINRDATYNPYGKDLDTISEKALDGSEFDYVVDKQHNNTTKELLDHTKNILALFDKGE